VEKNFCSGCLQSFSDENLFKVEGQYYCKYCLPDRAPLIDEEDFLEQQPVKINMLFFYSYVLLHIVVVLIALPVGLQYEIKSKTIWWVLIIINLPVAVSAFSVLFPTSKEFNKGLWYFFTPENLFPFSRNYYEDRQYSFLFGIPIMIAIALVLLEYVLTTLIYDMIYLKYF